MHTYPQEILAKEAALQAEKRRIQAEEDEAAARRAESELLLRHRLEQEVCAFIVVCICELLLRLRLEQEVRSCIVVCLSEGLLLRISLNQEVCFYSCMYI